jgi:hypothetical protein
MIDWGPWAEFAARSAATAFIVVFAGLAASRLGPKIGGVVIGLPIVLAPGFFFMMREHPADFVAASAAGAIHSLAATQVFLGAFIVASTRLGAWDATAAAIAAWCVVAMPLAFVPHDPLVGTGVFALATLAARKVGGTFLTILPQPPAPARWRLMVLRGLAAGLLVGGVTFAASRLGASIAGLLIAFPVGFCVILLSLRLDHGPDLAARTAHAGLLGVMSLVGFCLALALLSLPIGKWPAFCIALAVSVAITLALSSLARPRPT